MNLRSGILLTTLLFLIVVPTTTLHAEAVVTAGTNYNWAEVISLEDVSTTISIDGQVAITTIDQTFYNQTSSSDALYHFPLPPNATITGLGVWQGESIYYFDLTPQPDDSGHGGSSNMPTDLRDFLGRNPFVAPLHELPEQDAFTIRLEYAELMHYSFGIYSLNYPLGVEPSYINGPINDFSCLIEVSSPRAIENIQLDNFDGEILYQTPDSVAILISEDFLQPYEDMPFTMSVDQQDVGMWLMPHTDTIREERHFLAVLEPGNISDDEILQKSFTFVLDKSGSMADNNRIAEAREAAIYCIQHLAETDLFNLITFSDFVDTWQSEPVVASPANVADAVSFIHGLNATGWTRFNDAMVTALNQPVPDGVANQILVLSDGLPTAGETNLAQILTNIRTNNVHNASIFTVGVGPEGVSDLDFLRLIAYENHGNSIYLAPGTGDISESIATFFNQFASPVITDIAVNFGDVGAYEIYPPGPYHIFVGSQTVIAGMYTTPMSTDISVTGTIADHDTTITYGPFDFPDISADYEFVPRMWAIRKIDYWLAWMAVHGEDEETIEMIIDLSIRYGILTPYTSYETDFPTALGEELALTARTTPEGNRLIWHTPAGILNATYDVYRRSLDGQAWMKLNDTPVTSTTFFDRTAIPEVGYVYRVVMHGEDVESVVEEIRVDGEKKAVFALESVHPNPFNERTQVRFQLALDSRVRIDVYDILGRQVATLHDGMATTGRHAVSLDASRLSSGLYFLRMQATSLDGSGTSSRIARITLVK
ncbi:VWA domain-containing protein [bacterium]|nr:VWA domain-containing protein [bacterium]